MSSLRADSVSFSSFLFNHQGLSIRDPQMSIYYLPKCMKIQAGAWDLLKKKKNPCKWFFFGGVFCLFRAVPVVYGGSQARGWIRAVAAGLYYATATQDPSTSASYTTARDNAGSLTHWTRPRMEPTSSWILVRFVNHWATMGTPLQINLSLISVENLWLVRTYF